MSDYSYIINGVKPVAIESNSTVLARLLANQNAMQANEENSMKLAAMRQGVADDQTMRANTTQAAGDMSKLQQLAYGSGNYKGGAEVGRNVITNQKTQAENEKAQIENQFKKLDLAAQLMQGVVDQASYDRIKPEVLKFFGPEAAAKLPQVYDPQTVAENQAKSLSAKESMQLRLQELTQNETRVNNLRTDSRARDAQGVTLRGQDLTDRRARDAQGVAVRGQDMADARGRDLNETRVEENKLKREQKNEQAETGKANQLAGFDTMLDSVHRLAVHPGLPRSVGLAGAFPTVPGSQSANFQAELDTFQSQAFLPMVSQLKGLGALSDAEGKKLTAAVGALNPKMGEKAFRESIARIDSDMTAARDRLAQNQKSASVASPSSTNALEAEMRRRGLLK